MKDLFKKCHEPGGYFSVLREMRDRYFVMPKIEGSPGRVMTFEGQPVIQWTLNNYLGLADRPELIQAAVEAAGRWGVSAPMGSRFLTGNTDLHEELERRLARFVGKESAVLFNYGYLGVLGTVQALVDKSDTVVIDALCHASMMDAAFGAREFVPFRHNDPEAFEKALQRATRNREGGVLVMLEGVYGMTGDLADLPSLLPIAKRYGARVFLDDAHGLGSIGRGKGTAHHHDSMEGIDVYFSTFAKSFAAIGGFSAVEDSVAEYLRYNVRTQIFAKSLPLVVVEVLLKTLDIIEQEPQLYERLWNNVRRLQNGLRNAGFDLGNTQSAITPVYLPSDDPYFAMKIVKMMRAEKGIFISAVTYPVVPKGTVLCRMVPTAAHTEEDIERTVQAFVEIRDHFKVSVTAG
jgi:glycine C-acetyltransferase